MIDIREHGGAFGGAGKDIFKVSSSFKRYTKGIGVNTNVNGALNTGDNFSVPLDGGNIGVFNRNSLPLLIKQKAFLFFLPSVSNLQPSNTVVTEDRIYVISNVSSTTGDVSVYDFTGTLIKTVSLAAPTIRPLDNNHILMVQGGSSGSYKVRLYDKDLNLVWESGLSYSHSSLRFVKKDTTNDKICFYGVRYYEYRLSTGALIYQTNSAPPSSYLYRINDDLVLGLSESQFALFKLSTDTISTTFNVSMPSGTLKGLIAVDTDYYYVSYNGSVSALNKSTLVPAFTVSVASSTPTPLPVWHSKGIGTVGTFIMTQGIEYLE